MDNARPVRKARGVTKPKTEWVAEEGRWKEVELPGTEEETNRAKSRRQSAMLLSVNAVKLAQDLPKGVLSQVVGMKLLEAATQVGVSIRGADRTRSEQDALNKLRIAEDAADETVYWLDLMKECQIGRSADVDHLRELATSVTEIVVEELRERLSAQQKERAERRDFRGGGGGGYRGRDRDGGDYKPRDRDGGDYKPRDRDGGDYKPRDREGGGGYRGRDRDGGDYKPRDREGGGDYKPRPSGDGDRPKRPYTRRKTY